MTELQEARADWIASLQENQRLLVKNHRLKDENYELQAKLISSQCQATIMQELANGYAKALLIV